MTAEFLSSEGTRALTMTRMAGWTEESARRLIDDRGELRMIERSGNILQAHYELTTAIAERNPRLWGKIIAPDIPGSGEMSLPGFIIPRLYLANPDPNGYITTLEANNDLLDPYAFIALYANYQEEANADRNELLRVMLNEQKLVEAPYSLHYKYLLWNMLDYSPRLFAKYKNMDRLTKLSTGIADVEIAPMQGIIWNRQFDYFEVTVDRGIQEAASEQMLLEKFGEQTRDDNDRAMVTKLNRRLLLYLDDLITAK
jgi:hypothetical protein